MSEQDIVQLLHVRHHAPLLGEQIGELARFQQGENLSFPLGTFFQELANLPFTHGQLIKQSIKQEGSGSVVQTLQGGHRPTAGRFDQTINLVAVAIKHFTRHLNSKENELQKKPPAYIQINNII